jgi:UDP-glucose 4-epimerase
MRAASGHRGTFNLATGVETSVRELWDILADESGTTIEPEPAPLREGELERSCLSFDRAHAQLGWSPAVSIDAGLRSTYHAMVEELERGTAR